MSNNAFGRAYSVRTARLLSSQSNNDGGGVGQRDRPTTQRVMEKTWHGTMTRDLRSKQPCCLMGREVSHMPHELLLHQLVDQLKPVHGLKAIVLGGSYAKGTQRPA